MGLMSHCGKLLILKRLATCPKLPPVFSPKPCCIFAKIIQKYFIAPQSKTRDNFTRRYNMDNGLCVRVDYYNDEKMVPISFKQNDATTKFIRKIKRIWHENDAQSEEIVRYSCLLTDETTIILSFKNGRWYI